MKKVFLILSIFLSVSVGVKADGMGSVDMRRPMTFWYWMYGAVSKEGIRADLQSMKDAGLAGCYLMPIRGVSERPEFGGKAQQLSPEFWEMVDYALFIADSLRLDLGIHICDGFALAGGPWITPRESMQKVVWTDTIVKGPMKSLVLPRHPGYEGYYEDIAAFALPYEEPKAAIDGIAPKISLSGGATIDEKGQIRSNEPCRIVFEYDSPRLCRSIEIKTPPSNLQAKRLKVLASDDGKTFREIRQLTPPRQGWQEGKYNTTYAIPPTTARYFAFDWTAEGSEPGAEDLDAAKWKPNLKVNGIKMSSEPVIDQWEGKAGYAWRIATSSPEITDESGIIPLKKIVWLNLSGDEIATKLPAGTWRIIRMGHTSTGQKNETAGGGKGLECDKFSAGAVTKQVSKWFDKFKSRPHSNVIKYMHVDSWECGCQNWSNNFIIEFQRRRGYDLFPYLPVMAGIPVESHAKSDSVLYDIRLTINDLINDVFFATVKNRAADYGCLFSSESVAPTMISDGIEHYKYCDLPMGEFWLNSPTHDKPNDMLDAVSGAHIYGKNIVQAEGFTEVRGVWDETPADIKPLLDRNFCLGMNRLFFHVSAHNPWTDRRPGMTLDGIGLFFQRDQTWMKEARGLVDYVTRCQTLLQQGCPVADIAVFSGEEMPSRAVMPWQLTDVLPGIIGSKRVEAEKERMANVGLKMEESPVGVRHIAGIPDMKNWVNPLNGYAYDSMNPDVLMSATTNNGCVASPYGPAYKVLVLPKPLDTYSNKVQEKVASLRQGGATIIAGSYSKADFSEYNLPKDIILPEGIGYSHRRTSNGTDIWFLSNQTSETKDFIAEIRPEATASSARKGGDAAQANGFCSYIIYDPLTNKYSHSIAKRENLRGLSVRIPSLAPYSSVFFITSPGTSNLLSAVLPDAEEVSALPCLSAQSPTEIELSLLKPWDVSFLENGVSLSTDKLFDWSQSENTKIRYYSGTAKYQTTFSYKGKISARSVSQPRIYLSLENLHDVAHVWVNGIDCGTVWTSPYQADITAALRKGKNDLCIGVTNTWANALRGADKNQPPYDGIWTNAKYRMSGDTLLPAGLLRTPKIVVYSD